MHVIEDSTTLLAEPAMVLRGINKNYDGVAALTDVTVRVGDGYGGWPEHAPFDIIIVTAAPEHVPQPLIDQLKPGGRLIVPVGPRFTVQQLQLLEKDAAGEVRTRNVSPVMFVPLRRP